MKFTGILMAAFAAFAAAQINEIPPCAHDPILNAMSKVGCEKTDFKCACSKFDELRNKATQGIIASCGIPKAVSEVLPAVKKVCGKN